MLCLVMRVGDGPIETMFGCSGGKGREGCISGGMRLLKILLCLC